VSRLRKEYSSEVWDCDTLINCMAYGNHSDQRDIGDTISVNIIKFGNLLNMGMFKTVYNLSTSSIHLKKQTAYSLTKQLGEMIVNEYNNPNYHNVRPYSVFGEGEREDRLIPTIIRCLNSGETMNLDLMPKHDWIYVEDFIDLMFANVVECGTGISYTNYDIVKLLERISGKKLNYREVTGLREYDCQDWKCPQINEVKIGLYEGLKRTYEYYTKI
jgi:nucleoside-diphosphate-sugar epimerase